MATTANTYGVQKEKNGKGWTWRCGGCDLISALNYPSRAEARESYRIHRRELCDPAAEPETVEEAKAEPAEPKAEEPKAEEPKASAPRKQSKASAGGNHPEINWRLATITNPKTGKSVTLELRKDGGLVPSDAKRLGIDHVKEWTEVRAVSRVEALKIIAAGGGEKKRR